MADSDAGTLETRKDAGEGEAGLVKLWLQAIALAEKEEEVWVKGADKAIERWRDEKRDTETKSSQFNILFASTETLCPAIYNAVPRPDVRRRFRDSDPVAAKGAQVLERGLAYSIECSDLDECIRCVVFDQVLPGRGVARVRYLPRQLTSGEVGYEDIGFEHVNWRDFVRGPGRTWDEVPWIAFKHRVTREQIIKLNDKIGATINLDCTLKDVEKSSQTADIFKRGLVYEIWDKEQRKVLFIAPAHKDAPLLVDEPFCVLKNFFPIPRPLYDIKDTNSLVPKVPYSVYEDQAGELDSITKRISALIKVLKWRGFHAGIEGFEKLANAADGELVPLENLKNYDDIDKALWLMPIDKAAQVLRELYAQRAQLKQEIFELTGVADVMRGQTDPNETLGAQQLKAQWGSVRLKDRQKEVQRFARDMIRIAAEIIAEKFSPETMMVMTGIDMPMQAPPVQAMPQQAIPPQMAQPQPPASPPLGGAVQPQQMPAAPQKPAAPVPTWASVVELLRSDALRSYRIDIETDSTLEPDQMQAQKSMAEFVSGTANYFAAIGHAVQAGAFPMEVAAKLYSSFARQFKLGRQAEDALDSLEDLPPQPKKPDPKAQAEAASKETDQAKLAFEQKKHNDEMSFKREEARGNFRIERKKLALSKAEALGKHMLERKKIVSDYRASRVDARRNRMNQGAISGAN